MESVDLTDSDEEANIESEMILSKEGVAALFDTLSIGLSTWLLHLKNRRRPAKYKKISLTEQKPARTQRYHRAKVKHETARLRAQGYQDIQLYFQAPLSPHHAVDMPLEVDVDWEQSANTDKSLPIYIDSPAVDMHNEEPGSANEQSPPLSPVSFTEDQVAALHTQIHAFRSI
ncbi:uncharacterized protein FOMMEDRAFT_150913 [Fomitiporia mediterranea MF3/22]|uniref:uncharacterized protein n=1 Tax=Fomitiporia mediterranea (strain MF3/22) TaxID=694068 RepID=UPI000440786D|nr:uncharacterized protein FOMMEDRAFT_150913 [Fomitiporia mediterranea MF3/22]EJD08203.1 hypothetical protein FOMMEDRAFT_150913 [Fomitiporia mediterranea MF3/22]